MSREVTISVKVDETGSEGAFKRLTARFNELGDVSDKALKGISSKLQNQLIVGLNKGGNREYLETIRRLSPEIRTLHEQIKAGSFDLTDYNRRMAMLPSFLRTAMNEVKGLGEAFRQTEKDLEGQNNELGKTLVGLNLLERAVDFVKQKISEGKDEFLKFGKEMSAIGTIVDDSFDLSKARDEIASLPAALGKSSELANAFKLAVGSGVEAGKALEFTANSAKAAKAGFAGVTETVDASTTILNSFGIQAERVNTVYDLMFQTVKSGKIEFSQLSQSIGQVSNVAAQSGVKLEEMFAVIATATATTKPSIAIEAFRSALSNILKPSQEAAKLAESLGLQFNVSALRAKGFATFLQDVIDKTKGNTDQLAILFGDVQGLNSILSITGAQAQNFSKNLNEMSNASGNVDKAFQKQQQSLSAQIENFGVTFEKRLGTVLTIVEPILIAIFSAINKYPNAFTAAAFAVGALTLAHLLLNTQLVASAATSIPNFIRGLITTITTMSSLSTAMAAGATGLVAFTAGWGILLAAIGIAGYALYNYSQAQQKTTEEHLKGVNAVQEQVKSLNQQKQTLDNLQGNISGLSMKQKELADIYAVLDTSSKNRVDAATAEKGAVGALAEEVERLTKAKKLEADARLTELASKTYEAYEKQKTAVEAATKAELQYQDALTNGRQDYFIPTGDTARFVSAEEQFQGLREEQIKTAESSREATKEFEQLKSALQSGSQILGTTADQFILNKEATNQLSRTSEDFRQVLSVTGSAQENLANKTQNTTGIINQQTSAIKSLRDQLKGLISESQARIDERVAYIAMNAKDKAEAREMARRSMGKDDFLYQDFQTTKRLTDNEKAVREVFSPSEKSGSRLKNVKKDATEAKTAVKTLKTELGDLQSVLDAMRKGTMMQESGGDQKIQNGRTKATGLFQVMPENIPNWTKEYVGKIFSVKQFQKDADAQITVFNGEMGKYLKLAMQKSNGNVQIAIRMAAAAWYGGKGAMNRYDDPTKFRKDEPSFREYTTSVLRRTMQAAGGGKLSEVAVFDKESQTLRSILDTRSRINQLINEGGDANQRELDGLQEYENSLKQIERLVDQINSSGLKDFLVVGLPDTQEDAKNTVERLQTFTQLQNTLKSQKENTAQQIFEMSEQFTDGLTEIEKFDYQLQKLRATGKLTANDFGLLANDIDDVRQQMKKAEEMKWAEKLANDAKAVSSALSSMTTDFRGQMAEIALSENEKPFAGWLEQIKQINEIDLPTEAFDDLRQVISPDGIDIEKLAGIARAWLEISAAIGGTDPTKIDEIVNKIKLTAQSFNDLTAAQKQAKNADDYKSLNESLDSEYAQLLRNGRELTVYEQTLQDLQKTYKNLSQSEKDNLLIKAQQIDAQREYNEQYEKTYDFIRNTLDILTDAGATFGEKMKSIFGGIFQSFRKMILDMTAQWLTSKIFGGGSANGSGSGSGNGGFLDIFKGIFGGGNASSTPSFNPNAGSGSFLNNRDSATSAYSGMISTNTGGVRDFAGNIIGNSGSSSGLGNIRNMFSNREGGLFAPVNGSALGGYIGGGASIANLVGGLIGGRVGGAISGAASGALMGLQIGGPWGALIGGGAGLIMSLLGGDPKRRKDKKENIPALQKGFTESFKEFEQLVSDLKSLRIGGEGAISKARELRTQIASGFGINFESPKYRKESQKMITAKLTEIDRRNEDPTMGGLMQQVEYYAELAKGADNRNKRIVAEFATGAYLSKGFASQYADFKRRNGILPGSFTGRDTLPAMLAEGEMVLNPRQIKRVIQNAQFSQNDPFLGANIPGYASGISLAPTPAPSSPPSVSSLSGQIIVQPNFTLILEEGVTFDDKTKAYLESDSGKRVQVNIQKQLKKQGLV